MLGDKMPCDYGSRHPDPVADNLTREEREEIGIETEEEDAKIWIGNILSTRLKAITEEQLAKATAEDPALATLIKEKREGQPSKETSKGPYGKIWTELSERNSILLREKLIVIPGSLHTHAIALAHEGHMKADGTLRQLREGYWFRGMRAKVQEYVDTCNPGCTTSNPNNPTPPLKLKPLPKEPWMICVVDFEDEDLTKI